MGYNLQVLSDKVEIRDNNTKNSNILYSKNMNEVLKNADVVIAPLSSTDKKGNLKSTFIDKKITLNESFFNKLSKDTLFIIGFINSDMKEILENKKIDFIELTKLDEIAILNAIPTAEGAIKIGIEKTDFTLYHHNILILGLGRVGLTLGWRLNLLGANVYAATRSKAAIARGKDLGLNMINYNELNSYLSKMNIIYNTVPALILNSKRISNINKNCLIIDLASSPGGTDFKAAENNNIKAILASGLPGKIAPKTAAQILTDVIPELIQD